MIMLSALSYICFLHHAHLTCYVALYPCHFAFHHAHHVGCILHVVCASALDISLSSHALVSSPLPSFFLHVFASDIFPLPLMFIYFLVILLLALYFSVKFHSFWSCFGWVQKWLKFEFNSNLNYFYILKNGQSNLFKYCISPGDHINFLPSFNPLQSLCTFCPFISV
jgi:hypothetical protein